MGGWLLLPLNGKLLKAEHMLFGTFSNCVTLLKSQVQISSTIPSSLHMRLSFRTGQKLGFSCLKENYARRRTEEKEEQNNGGFQLKEDIEKHKAPNSYI